MNAPAALRCTYADIKTVRTRKVYQIVFEGPIEEMAHAMAVFGAPMPDAEVWAGIARLIPARPSAPQIEQDRPPAKLSQIAGILCNEGAFRRWLCETGDFPGIAVLDLDMAVDELRRRCGVPSRRELDTDGKAAARFRDLKGEYEAWRRAA